MLEASGAAIGCPARGVSWRDQPWLSLYIIIIMIIMIIMIYYVIDDYIYINDYIYNYV